MFLIETVAFIAFFPVCIVAIKRSVGAILKMMNWSFDNLDDLIHKIIRG